jgi:hypothetical protein
MFTTYYSTLTIEYIRRFITNSANWELYFELGLSDGKV